jgi:hypothetical protein
VRNGTVDPILAPLTDDELRTVEHQLSNSIEASDEALFAQFIANGLTDVQAARALRYRRFYLHTVFLQGHTPIRKGKHAIRFDPIRRRFEIVNY